LWSPCVISSAAETQPTTKIASITYHFHGFWEFDHPDFAKILLGITVYLWVPFVKDPFVWERNRFHARTVSICAQRFSMVMTSERFDSRYLIALCYINECKVYVFIYFVFLPGIVDSIPHNRQYLHPMVNS
jgi:hypothetical protein